MKTLILMLAASLALGLAASAAEPEKKADKPAAEVVAGKMVGSVATVTFGEDQKSATVVLKDSKSGEEVEIFIDDQVTLEKLKDKRISVGDEIRCKYEPQDGKRHSTYFRKVGGC